MELTKLSLFSGILGDDLASEWAGIKTVCCVENEPFCQAVIKKHYPDMPIIGDIHDVTKEKVKEVSGYEWVDIIAGGDPCQPRSIAGKRRGREDDRDLWKDMFRVVCEFKPTWVVNENPTGRLTMDFHEVLSDLESQGYETRSFVIPACAVGAWHRRDRLYIIANLISQQTVSANEGGFHAEPGVLDRENRDDTNIMRKRLSFSELRNNTPRPQKQKTTTAKSLALPIADSDRKRQQQPQRGFGKFGNWLEYSYWRHSPIKAITRFCRDTHGIPAKVDRIKALGNTQVPQQIYPIYKAIVEVANLQLTIESGL